MSRDTLRLRGSFCARGEEGEPCPEAAHLLEAARADASIPQRDGRPREHSSSGIDMKRFLTFPAFLP